MKRERERMRIWDSSMGVCVGEWMSKDVNKCFKREREKEMMKRRRKEK